MIHKTLQGLKSLQQFQPSQNIKTATRKKPNQREEVFNQLAELLLICLAVRWCKRKKNEEEEKKKRL